MIVCCGEALVDLLPGTTADGASAFVPHAGGAVFNSAIALGRLGVAVEFFSGLSSDLFGQTLSRALAGSNVGARYAIVSARPTTLAFVELDNGHARYVFYDENTAGRMLSESELPVFDGDVTALLFGAISLIPEPCGTAYEGLMRREHASRVTMLDPNIRPGFIADREKHLARMHRMIGMADIVKLSQEDLAWFGEAGSVADVARRWLGRGPKLVIVTSGPEGAVGYTARETVSVPAPQVEMVDTVGAGDTFNAGVLASLAADGLLSKAGIAGLDAAAVTRALSLGARAASVTVSRAGPNPPWRHELA